jgi:hypothetical protein
MNGIGLGVVGLHIGADVGFPVSLQILQMLVQRLLVHNLYCIGS